MISRNFNILGLCLLGIGFWPTAPGAQGEPYTWPTYSSRLNYSFKNAGLTFNKPTRDVNGACIARARAANGIYHGEYWAFYHGANKNPLVTEAAIQPMLQRFDRDFSYITDTLGWPRDSRVRDGFFSAIYLYGSDPCTGSNDPNATGGWQSHIDGYPAVLASYYPVYSFDPRSTYSDRLSQQGAMIHEGIHAILTNLGASHVHWFQEGGNTWLQQEMEVRRSNNSEYSGMGFLNVGNLMAPFVPIESYSGWLLDGSFGGPGAEGVNAGAGVCNWRNVLGGVQYGNLFPTFLGLWVAEGAVPWIWVNIPNRNGEYILESMAAAVGGAEVRSIIMEYRAKLAMMDMKKWSNEMRRLLNGQFGRTIGCEFTPCAVQNVPTWRVTPYVVTTETNRVLTPEERTLPGWSGANVIPITVSPGATQVSLTLQDASTSMALQIAYRATDGTPVYSTPVFGNNTATLNLTRTPQSNVVFAIVTFTEFNYVGDATRRAKGNYRLRMDQGVTAAADPHTRWYNNFNLVYDWDRAKVVTSPNSSSSTVASSSSTALSSSLPLSSSSVRISSSSVAVSSSSFTTTTITHNVTMPIANDYRGTAFTINFDQIATGLGISAAAITASMISGMNLDGSLHVGNTANGDAGHWFAANGNVVPWNTTTAFVYAEWSVSGRTVTIGHYPDKVLDGEMYLVRQVLRSGARQVIVEFRITALSPTTPVELEELRRDLKISHREGLIIANYTVQTAGKVKLGLYTGYGALISNVVDGFHAPGSYSSPINLKALNLPGGVYLLRLSYPGHTETQAAITAVR